jgi:hypothetical protein
MPRHISQTFHFDRTGRLVRSIVPRRGSPYDHTCEKDVFEKVAYAIEEAGDRGVNIAEVAVNENVPFTQAYVAAAFMDERGLLEREGRRTYAATDSVALDAIIEWYALLEGSPGSQPAGDALDPKESNAP